MGKNIFFILLILMSYNTVLHSMEYEYEPYPEYAWEREQEFKEIEKEWAEITKEFQEFSKAEKQPCQDKKLETMPRDYYVSQAAIKLGLSPLDTPQTANPYKVLNVPRNAGNIQIRDAYKKLAKKWHPDKNPEDRELATEAFKFVNSAFDELSKS